MKEIFFNVSDLLLTSKSKRQFFLNAISKTDKKVLIYLLMYSLMKVSKLEIKNLD